MVAENQEHLTDKRQVASDTRVPPNENPDHFECSAALIFRLDQDLRYIYISPVAKRFGSINLAEFLGRSVLEIQLPDHGATLASKCAESRDSNQRVSWNFESDGRKYNIQIVPEYGPNGEFESLLGITEEITQQERVRNELSRIQQDLNVEHMTLLQVLRQVPTAVMIVEAPTARVLMVNEHVERIWKERTPDINNVDEFCEAFKAFHLDGTEYSPEERPLLRSIIKGETVSDAEYDLVRPDGSHTELRVSTAPIRDAGGNIVAGVAVFFDISKQRREQEFLAGESRVLEMIARGAPLMYVLDSVVRLVESQADGMLCSILILQEDGQHLRHGAAPSLPDFYVKAIDGSVIGPRVGSCGTAMYRGKPVIVTDVATDPLWEDFRELALAAGLRACWSTPIFSSSGRVLGSFACYYRAPRGPTPDEQRLNEVATHLAGIAIERKRAEEAVRESEERYRNVVEAQTDMICRYLPDGTLTFINDAYCRYFQRTRDQLIGTTFYELLPPNARETARQFTASLIAEPRVEYVEHEVVRPDGELGWQQWIDHVIYDSEGTVIELQGIGRDVTERRMAEQALRRSEEELRSSHEQIRELAGRLMTAQEEERRRISRELHDDLNQKVAALAILISRIKHQLEPTAAVTEQLEHVRERTNDIADDIRRLSRQLHPSALEPIGLTAALKSFVSEFSSLEEIEIHLTAPETSEIIPRDVALCLYRVAQEPLRNIVKYANAKRADVSVTLSDDEVILKVSDSGKGFDLASARHIGGLGLVSMEERVRLLQGKFTIHSQLGMGTTVEARIPLKKTHSAVTL